VQAPMTSLLELAENSKRDSIDSPGKIRRGYTACLNFVSEEEARGT
jgi:hypothetical protein